MSQSNGPQDNLGAGSSGGPAPLPAPCGEPLGMTFFDDRLEPPWPIPLELHHGHRDGVHRDEIDLEAGSTGLVLWITAPAYSGLWVVGTRLPDMLPALRAAAHAVLDLEADMARGLGGGA